MRKTVLLSLSVIIVIGAVTAGVVGWYQHENFITTDNAKVSADMATVAVANSGMVTSWSAEVGDKVQVGDQLGREAEQPTESSAKKQQKLMKQPQGMSNSLLQKQNLSPVRQAQLASKASRSQMVAIRSTMDGTIIGMSGQKGLAALKGTSLAMIADLEHPYILAYIDEEDVEDVSKGQKVDVTLDADSSQTLDGKVDKIGYEAGNQLTQQAIDNKASQGNKDRETQRVPVRIKVEDLNGGRWAIPGLSAMIKIHK
ncbi:Multidrug resistance efflux pump [Marininema mesophilum]|uniref:Multidrug resistance efflux pump n=1 Tax=Marininema mesophilum TaxID=1048340 RepID=A0A1H3ASP9_9BACL|nr:HlyD family efflux transporter periplasmic adaptor subunit [Marininema mesophilum]SDX32428.1 Multidrug resistance efflux pump [Marininema mesophilum]